MIKEKLFEVLDNGHLYTVYTTGEVEGFSQDAKISNHYPHLLFRAISDAVFEKNTFT